MEDGQELEGTAEEVPWLTRLPSEYMREHIRVTDPADAGTAGRPLPRHELLEMFYADEMLMFSTDYPHWDGDTPEHTFKRIPKHMWQQVMVDNPMGYYRMTEEDTPPV